MLTVEPLLDMRVEVVLALQAGLEGGAQAGRQLSALYQVPGHPTKSTPNFISVHELSPALKSSGFRIFKGSETRCVRRCCYYYYCAPFEPPKPTPVFEDGLYGGRDIILVPKIVYYLG